MDRYAVASLTSFVLVCPLRQQLVRKLFEDFDGDRDGLVSHKEFEEGYRRGIRHTEPGWYSPLVFCSSNIFGCDTIASPAFFLCPPTSRVYCS